MRRTIATAVLLAISTHAYAQAQYEIGYRFDNGPEVVRVATEPIFAQARSDPPPQGVLKEAVLVTQRILGRSPSLTIMDAEMVCEAGDDAHRTMSVRSRITFNDVVFSSTLLDEVQVALNLRAPGLRLVAPPWPEYAGIQHGRTIRVEIDGQSFNGVALATLTGDTRRFTVERTGIFADQIGEFITIDGFTLPTNQSLEITIEYTKHVERPDGISGSILRNAAGFPELAFPQRTDVFDLPPDVHVYSEQAGIRNNRWADCGADVNLDGTIDLFDYLLYTYWFWYYDPAAEFDGEPGLSIFDFLAFQNAFDAGCP